MRFASTRVLRLLLSMNKRSKIYVAGHSGMVGSAILRHLKKNAYENIVTRSHEVLDLMSAREVGAFFEAEKPDYVFVCAAKVGGIYANNQYPADFLYNNLLIQANLIHEAYRAGVQKLLFLGSSCIYPRDCPQPIREEYLLTGPLEKTNEAYAIAKIAGIKLCQSYRKQYGCNFISVMPTNIYGPNDNYHLENSHVLPAILRKVHEALPDKDVTLWGTGEVKREFLFADDLAAACTFLMLNYDSPEIINVGASEDLSIRDLARRVQQVLGHRGRILWDESKPDGTPRKKLDISKLKALGWECEISLPEGIRRAYEDFKERLPDVLVSD